MLNESRAVGVRRKTVNLDYDIYPERVLSRLDRARQVAEIRRATRRSSRGRRNVRARIFYLVGDEQISELIRVIDITRARDASRRFCSVAPGIRVDN